MSGIPRAAAVAAIALCTTMSAAAQGVPDSVLERQRRTVDSLAASLRILQARMDSLHRSRADSGADALAAVRAAAAFAARDSAPAAAASGARGQNALNPEISVTGDVRGVLVRPGPRAASFDPHEFEFSFQSALDPMSATKVFVGIHDGEVDVEEAYVYWAGLPGHLRLDLGKFRQTIGELNRWHLHALPEGEYPLVLQRYLGEEGLAQTGLSLYWPLPFSGRLGAYELTTQVTKGVNEALFGPFGDRLSYLGQLLGFWQFSRSVYGQVSLTGLAGEGHDSVAVWPPSLPPGGGELRAQRIQSRLGALAVRFTWRPPAEAQRREVTLRGEVYALQRTVDGDPVLRHGAYAAAQVRAGRRWIAGVRGDWVETTDPASPRPSEWAVTPTLTFWQSEFVYLRLQWTRRRDLAGDASDRFGVQAVWAMGPHKHELF